MSHDKAQLLEKPPLSAREKVVERRRAILGAIREAAIDEFSSKGLIGASTQAIAQRAGLTKPQLHYYISSKEELYEDILVFILKEWRELFFSATAGESPVRASSATTRSTSAEPANRGAAATSPWLVSAAASARAR